MSYLLLLYLFLHFISFSNSFLLNKNKNIIYLNIEKNRYNPFVRKYYEQFSQKNNKTNNNFINVVKKYPLTRPSYVEEIKKLNSRNISLQNEAILDNSNDEKEYNDEKDDLYSEKPKLRIIINKSDFFQTLGIKMKNNEEIDNFGNFEEDDETGRKVYVEKPNSKSKNFEVIKTFNILFKDIGGYKNVKDELIQCVDILNNYQKYIKFNVRIPKGLILEGPPGTGKTLFAKALAGEAKCNFIPVSGSDFQEKYVGVGPTRIKELFELARKNIPCIIFIDEIDALGRKRSSDGESSSNERDSTLNALLVELDGFKNNTGIFIIAATNRIDLLDSALIRPGRIDKKIYIGLPDKITRKSILDIHIHGKPYDNSVVINELVEITEGFTGAQIENLLNEAMLNALRNNNTEFCYKDFDFVLNKIMAGWQPNDHEFSTNIINHIAIHEMGHAIVGLLSKHHSKLSKVVINLSSPKSPGYTVFEGSSSNIFIREALFEHLMILLAGRIAEEVFYNISVTTGAINDFEEALKLAEKMIIYYGMGKNIIYPSLSDKYKEMIDNEVVNLIDDAYKCANIIIQNAKEFIQETSEILKRDKIIKVEKLNELMKTKYNDLLYLKIEFE